MVQKQSRAGLPILGCGLLSFGLFLAVMALVILPFLVSELASLGQSLPLFQAELASDISAALKREHLAASVSTGAAPLSYSPAAIHLARIMQGESPGDREAAYRVGWVAKNRLKHIGYGQAYAFVRYGFFGYQADLQPSQEFLELAEQVLKANEDPTHGSLYALSRTDVTNLAISPTQADLTYGEWFFFKHWPEIGYASP